MNDLYKIKNESIKSVIFTFQYPERIFLKSLYEFSSLHT